MKAAALVASYRLATLVVPFRRISRMESEEPETSRLAPSTVEHLAWAVSTAARAVPGGNCLPQALALRQLLRRRQEPSVLRLGVRRDDKGRLQAHAWVDWDGRTVIGGDVGHLVPLATAKTAAE